MSEAIETTVPTAQPVGSAQLLLPRNLAALAALCSDGEARFSATCGVRLEKYGLGDGNDDIKPHYRAIATNGRVLGMVSGQCEDLPHAPCLPGLSGAPNGENAAIIGSKEWTAAFKALPKTRFTSAKPVLNNVFAVMGREVTTLATTDLATESMMRPRNVEGRFPPFNQVIPDEDRAAFTIDVDPHVLITLLKCAAAFTDEESKRVTLRFYGDTKPFRVDNHCQNGQKFTGVIVPLCPAKK